MHFSVPGVPFDVGDLLPAPALRRAQAYVDLLSQRPPRPGKGERAHPLRTLLDAVAAAEGWGETPGGPGDPPRDGAHQSHLRGGEGGPGGILRGLEAVLGVGVGSGLHRDWVRRPRAHLEAVVRVAGGAVVRRFLRGEDGARGEGYDVHVQLWPSSRGLAGEGGERGLRIAAAVAIRRRGELLRVERRQRELEGRLMAVAAADQTLESAIAFWRVVRAGDRPRGALAAYAPLGLQPLAEAVDDGASGLAWNEKDEDEPANVAESGEHATTVLGSWPSVRKRYLRRVPAELRASVNASAIARRIFEEEEEEGEGVERRGLWRQPDALLKRSAESRPSRSGPPRVCQSPQALVAVLYITLEGMVYPVRVTDVSSMGDTTLGASVDPSRAAAHREEVMGKEFAAGAASTELTQPYEGLVLPFNEDDSFTRGVLGL